MALYQQAVNTGLNKQSLQVQANRARLTRGVTKLQTQICFYHLYVVFLCEIYSDVF